MIRQDAWHQWLKAEQAACNTLVAEHLDALRPAIASQEQLFDAVAYSLGQGGKRLRPILVRASCAACGADPADARLPALAVECIHTFSLIHDDLPAMDDDDLRRGQPTNHKVFGEALAILAGDWLVAHAFSLLAHPEIRPERSAAMVRVLGFGSLGMVEGQAADIAGEGQPADPERVEFIHLHKTARLLEASCRLGGLCAGADERQLGAVTDFGRQLGLAFQIVDDLLDATGSTEDLGKRAGKDAAVEKQTFPAAFGVEESRRRARETVDRATQALEPLGSAAESLRGLAEYVLSRNY
jgi:geranylgeranyl diphosphate synthase type II